MKAGAGLVVVSLAIVLISPSLSVAHGGGLDSHGCHHDRKRGGYHCHRGAFAGRSFESQAEMLKEQVTSAERPAMPQRAPRPQREPAIAR